MNIDGELHVVVTLLIVVVASHKVQQILNLAAKQQPDIAGATCGPAPSFVIPRRNMMNISATASRPSDVIPELPLTLTDSLASRRFSGNSVCNLLTPSSY